ncbi:MAG: mannitol dehydrogenase family protein [Erysipelotrichaceae bacterium]|jgi:fructuronate reductase
MKLNKTVFKDKEKWIEKGYGLPEFDYDKVSKETKENPFWIHFGAGNLFKAFHASIAQELLNSKVINKGLIVVEGFDYEIIEKNNHKHDNLSILATLKSDGSVEKSVIGSVVESCILDSNNEKEFNRLKEIFRNPSLQMATFTITEKGYALTSADGKDLPDLVEDYTSGPDKSNSYLGKVASLLYERYLNGAHPIAMVSTDNCSHNGDKLYECMNTFAKKWFNNGFVEKGFVDYINSKKVSFPWSMIDKITPRPDAYVENLLKQDGIEDLETIVTSKNTYIAPFVNAEETEYLVIEDDFPNGREKLELEGVIFTDRETVDKVEKMKVCTCLNPLHTALAIVGCLLSFNKISDEMEDDDLRKMVEIIGYKEGLPVVVNPGILDPKEFIDTVINVRFPNPFMPDTPQRIATDTSQKLAIRFGETVKKYLISENLDINDLKLIPFVYACWLRYLMSTNDEGQQFTLSPDPLLEVLCPIMVKIKLGESEVEKIVKPILENEKIFGVNLYEAGLAFKVLEYFKEINSEKGAIRKTLHKLVNEVN